MPNLFGLSLLAFDSAIFIASALGDNQLAWLIGFCVLSICLFAMLQTNANLTGLEISHSTAAPVACGNEAKLQITVRNRSATDRLTVAIVPELTKGVPLSLVTKGALSLIPGHGEAQFHITMQSTKRGIYSLTQVRLSTVFPLGLFYSWKFSRIDEDIIVFPKPAGHLTLPPLRAAGSAADTQDFLGHRRFVAGDSLRKIDWKAYARGRPLLVKEFAAPQLRVLDYADIDAATSSEAKLCQLSTWVHQCHAARENFILVLPHNHIGPGAGAKHFINCLRLLASCATEDRQ